MSKLTGYVIEQDKHIGWDRRTHLPIYGGREYYPSSRSTKIDRTDISTAKVFPTLNGAKQGLNWAEGNAKIKQVTIKVELVDD